MLLHFSSVALAKEKDDIITEAGNLLRQMTISPSQAPSNSARYNATKRENKLFEPPKQRLSDSEKATLGRSLEKLKSAASECGPKEPSVQTIANEILPAFLAKDTRLEDTHKLEYLDGQKPDLSLFAVSNCNGIHCVTVQHIVELKFFNTGKSSNTGNFSNEEKGQGIKYLERIFKCQPHRVEAHCIMLSNISFMLMVGRMEESGFKVIEFPTTTLDSKDAVEILFNLFQSMTISPSLFPEDQLPKQTYLKLETRTNNSVVYKSGKHFIKRILETDAWEDEVRILDLLHGVENIVQIVKRYNDPLPHCV